MWSHLVTGENNDHLRLIFPWRRTSESERASLPLQELKCDRNYFGAVFLFSFGSRRTSYWSLPRNMFGLENSCHPLNQSDGAPKIGHALVACVFPRFWKFACFYLEFLLARCTGKSLWLFRYLFNHTCFNCVVKEGLLIRGILELIT